METERDRERHKDKHRGLKVREKFEVLPYWFKYKTSPRNANAPQKLEKAKKQIDPSSLQKQHCFANTLIFAQ